MKMDRRTFLKVGGATALGLGAGSGFRVYDLNALSAEEEQTGKNYGMVIDASKCDGCQACVYACKVQNNVPTLDDARINISWIWVVTLKQKFPNAKERFVPMLCYHCEKAPCVQVCPVQATFVREKGRVVLIDKHRCIGCRYCMVACPYRARYFNFKDPKEILEEEWRNPDEQNPEVPLNVKKEIRRILELEGSVGVRNPEVPLRRDGVVESCTFCVQRIDKGLKPACVETCKRLHKGAMVFGDFNDPDSDVSKLVASGKVLQVRADLGTEPKVYYIGL